MRILHKILNKSYIVIIILIGIFIDLKCCTMDKTFLDKEDIEWYECYHIGDTMIYESDFDQKRLIVRYHKMRNPKNHNPFDTEGELETFVLFTPFVIIMPHEIFGYISVGLYTENDTVMSFASMYSENYPNEYYRKYFVGSVELKEILNGDAIFEQNTVVNSELIQNDYIISYNGNKKKCGGRYTIKTSRDSVTDFIWTRNRGLISFTLHDTITYNLIKHIQHKPVIPIKQLH